MAVYSLLSAMVLTIAAILAGVLAKSGAIPFRQIAAASIVCWAASLALIPIQLWAATWKGLFLSMGLGFAGMAAGVLAAPEAFWFTVPWSWAIRLMCPIAEVHPNGSVLESGNPLMDTSVIPTGIAVSIAVFLAVTLLTAVWFNRREEKC